jgi:DNA-binding beta-propeller fold protein YncE
MSNRVGVGNYQYELLEDWGQLHDLGKDLKNSAVVSGVACDSKGQVYVAVRNLPYPEILSGAILVFNRDGKFLKSIGEDLFTTPHLLHINSNDEIYYTDATDHTVHKISPSGEILMTLGGYKIEPGERPIDRFKTISAPGEPFNRPTKVVEYKTGELFVSDGYGQNRIHKLTSTGEVIVSWGETGKGPGQFELPHSLNVDKQGRVYVLDRPNNRCQIFNSSGEYLEEWKDIVDNNGKILNSGEEGPNDIIFDEDDVIHISSGFGQVSLMTLRGDRIGDWIPGPSHGMWIDDRGDLYLAMLSNHERLRKYVRI